MDKIRLDGIQFKICVGVTEAEREVPQPCRIDLVLKTRLEKAGQSGELIDAVDYSAVFHQVEKICRDRPFVLLEEIAHEISERLLEDRRIAGVRVRISKLHPFDARINAVGIEIKRHQGKS